VTVQSFTSALASKEEPIMLNPDQPTQIDDVLTSSSGFRMAVVEAATPSLAVFRGITDQFVEGNKLASFSLPFDAFVHTRADASITLVAKLTNGDALPPWVQFDPQSGTFKLDPPPGFTDELQIKVIARDTEGREASSIFRFHVGDAKGKTSGRSGFSEQIRLAANRSMQGARVPIAQRPQA
jgi:hypothetical protein